MRSSSRNLNYMKNLLTPKFFRRFSKNVDLNKAHLLKPGNYFPIMDVRKIKIAEFNTSEQIVVQDLRKLKQKIKEIREDGLENFQVVADFDHTMTKYKYYGKQCSATFGMFKESPYTSQVLKITANYLYATYHKLEIDSKIPFEKKIKFLDEWLKLTRDTLVKEKISENKIKRVINESHIVLRNSLDLFIDFLNKTNTPIYIISGGISDIIHIVLRNLFNNEEIPDIIKIFSNKLIFSENGDVIGFEPNVVHSLNKNKILDKNKSLLRKNYMLLGDFIHDIYMTKSAEVKNQISICFMNNGFEREEEYKNNFDILLKFDGNFTVPNILLNYIFQKEEMKSMINQLPAGHKLFLESLESD